jgi:hypothetical protein
LTGGRPPSPHSIAIICCIRSHHRSVRSPRDHRSGAARGVHTEDSPVTLLIQNACRVQALQILCRGVSSGQINVY